MLQRHVVRISDNTQFGVGIRGLLLDVFAHEFGLSISNANAPETNFDWTFRSSMGVCRRLDYILVSMSLLVRECGPSGKLDLGSDHRAVATTMVCQKRGTYKRYEQKMLVKGWRPELDADGNASKYWERLAKSLQEHGNIEEAIHHVATTPGIRLTKKSGVNSWQSEEIQDLIKKRRVCSTPKDRAFISKLIKKTSRKHLRKYKNEEAANSLEKFSGLSDLPKILECPVVSSGNHKKIDCNIFAEVLKEIYKDQDATIFVDYEQIKSIPAFVYWSYWEL